MTHDPLSYQYVVFLGNDNGKINHLGNVWWAANREFDCIGDGRTPSEAITNCIERSYTKNAHI